MYLTQTSKLYTLSPTTTCIVFFRQTCSQRATNCTIHGITNDRTTGRVSINMECGSLKTWVFCLHHVICIKIKKIKKKKYSKTLNRPIAIQPIWKHSLDIIFFIIKPTFANLWKPTQDIFMCKWIVSVKLTLLENGQLISATLTKADPAPAPHPPPRLKFSKDSDSI